MNAKAWGRRRLFTSSRLRARKKRTIGQMPRLDANREGLEAHLGLPITYHLAKAFAFASPRRLVFFGEPDLAASESDSDEAAVEFSQFQE